MAFEELKEQAKDRALMIWSRIQESGPYNNLKERFESLPLIAQKAIGAGVGVLMALIILSIPLSYINSASEVISEFNDNRLLLRELMRVGPSAQMQPPLPPGLSSADMVAQAQGRLSAFQLQAEQIISVSPIADRSGLIPSGFDQQAIAVALSKLNLTQMVGIGFNLQSMAPGIKMIGMEVQANRDDNHYFDVTYKLLSPSLSISTDTGSNESKERGN